MIKMLFTKWKAKRLKRAADLVRAEGFAICDIKTVGGVAYIKHNNGNWMRIGRAAK